jgi:type IV pilus assembly protein PilO
MKLDLNTKGLGKKILKIKAIYKLIFSVVFGMLVFGALFYFLILPQFEEKQVLAEEYAKIKVNLDKMQAIAKNIDKYKKEYARLQEVMEVALKQLPETKDIPNLLRNVSNVGSETRVKVRLFQPKAMAAKEFYAELPFEIRYSGPFHNIAYFFDGLRKLDRIIAFDSFAITAPARGDLGASVVLEGTGTALTYVYVKGKKKEEEKKGQKKEEKKEEPKK